MEKMGTGTFESLEAARKYFEGDFYATESGIRIDELKDGSAVCSFEITEHHRNADGGVMGGAIFTLIDFSFAVASSSIHHPTVAQQVSVNYLNQPKGKKLTAKADCRKNGRSSCVYIVNVADETGREIATALMTGFKLRSPGE